MTYFTMAYNLYLNLIAAFKHGWRIELYFMIGGGKFSEAQNDT
jgi:hypothetical protein